MIKACVGIVSVTIISRTGNECSRVQHVEPHPKRTHNQVWLSIKPRADAGEVNFDRERIHTSQTETPIQIQNNGTQSPLRKGSVNVPGEQIKPAGEYDTMRTNDQIWNAATEDLGLLQSMWVRRPFSSCVSSSEMRFVILHLISGKHPLIFSV